jgi:glyoxylase-like metal-dependent hydrolase (beta-lactamase superfamily II)/rhodanese-related sulfurtransferase
MKNMIFRQLFDSSSSTYTYLVADDNSREAVIIDPVFEQTTRDLALVRELGLTLRYAVDTHCHADHVTGAWLLKEKTGCQILASKKIGAANVDIKLAHGDQIRFGEQYLEVRETPGHTDGCLTYVTHDQSHAFTGDALLIRGCGRSDFQQGDASTLFDSINDQILSLPASCLIYPGHDYNGRTVSSVEEEKKYNARIGGNASRKDFVGYMSAMQLPHPKHIDVALPANMTSGKPELMPAEPEWAPVKITFAGVMEVESTWVAEHLSDVYLLDVREAEERIPGEKVHANASIPLGQLQDRIDEIPSEKPIMAICRSGRRSAMAVNILRQAGYEKVASVAGGILGWKDEGLPTGE